MKRQVAAAYGVDQRKHIIDHLIPRSLGGADDVRNLWPQSPAESKIKDRLEVHLHRAVCYNGMPLDVAQRAFLDWVRSYRVYIGR